MRPFTDQRTMLDTTISELNEFLDIQIAEAKLRDYREPKSSEEIEAKMLQLAHYDTMVDDYIAALNELSGQISRTFIDENNEQNSYAEKFKLLVDKVSHYAELVDADDESLGVIKSLPQPFVLASAIKPESNNYQASLIEDRINKLSQLLNHKIVDKASCDQFCNELKQLRKSFKEDLITIRDKSRVDYLLTAIAPYHQYTYLNPELEGELFHIELFLESQANRADARTYQAFLLDLQKYAAKRLTNASLQEGERRLLTNIKEIKTGTTASAADIEKLTSPYVFLRSVDRSGNPSFEIYNTERYDDREKFIRRRINKLVNKSLLVNYENESSLNSNSVRSIFSNMYYIIEGLKRISSEFEKHPKELRDITFKAFSIASDRVLTTTQKSEKIRELEGNVIALVSQKKVGVTSKLGAFSSNKTKPNASDDLTHKPKI